MEAGEAVFELAAEPGGGPLQPLVVDGGDDHRHLGRHFAAAGTGQRARRQRAQGAQGKGQDPLAPLAVLGRARGGAKDQHPGAGVEVGAELSGASDDVAAVGHLTRQHGCDEGSRDLLALPLGRARALQLQGQQRRHHSRDRRVGSRLRPVAQLADRGVGDPQLDFDHAFATREQLLLLVRRGTGDGEDGAGAVDQGNGGIEQSRRGAGHRGQPGARLDRLRECVEQPRIPVFCSVFRPFRGCRHRRIIDKTARQPPKKVARPLDQIGDSL